eukprot:TRINITY_DN7320_c0_g1_i2.p1 TRINITY_DN7320_c0_g1~~TRINITY_DN7320_c0_g1_i2.p1  ORF type:complete len:352 (+),score=87.22 TRINITY_DN7320_c0_g1_i2:37-1092(+)
MCRIMAYRDSYLFFFFFFKQKTAYEMLRSLVGSEMCIRDRVSTQSTGNPILLHRGGLETSTLSLGHLTLTLALTKSTLMGLVDYDDSDSDEAAPAPAPVKRIVQKTGTTTRIVIPALANLPPPESETPEEAPVAASTGALSFLPKPKHVTAPAQPKARVPVRSKEEEEEEEDDGLCMFGSALNANNDHDQEEVEEDAPELGPQRPPEGANLSGYTQEWAPQPQAQVAFDYIDWVDPKDKPKARRGQEQIPDWAQMVEVNAGDTSFVPKVSEEYKAQLQNLAAPKPEVKVQAPMFNRNGGTMTMCSGATRIAKRKHQIHTLAVQAVQREAELNLRTLKHKKTKSETYSRYGW